VNNSFKPRKKRKPKAGPVAVKLSRRELEALSTAKIPSYNTGKVQYASISVDRVGGGAHRKSMTDPMFLAGEKEETRNEIIAKSKRVAVAYNKGAYQYISSAEDAKYVGRKI
jgi:hypothetical protein